MRCRSSQAKDDLSATSGTASGAGAAQEKVAQPSNGIPGGDDAGAPHSTKQGGSR